MNSLFPMKKRKLTEVIGEIMFLPKEIQTELSMTDIDLLFEYYQSVADERDELSMKLSNVLIDFKYFAGFRLTLIANCHNSR